MLACLLHGTSTTIGSFGCKIDSNCVNKSIGKKTILGV